MANTLLESLEQIESLKEVPAKQLEWLIEHGVELTFAPGDYLFKKGDPIDRLNIILEGRFAIKMEQNGHFKLISNLEANSITGYLPYSRATTASGYAEALVPAKVLSLHKDHFKFMIHEFDELTTVLVHEMSTRIRNFTKLQQQNDKMTALGKLSAGLAHELNNPSAAVVRSAQSLKKHLAFLPDHFKSVIKIRVDDHIIDTVNQVVFDKAAQGVVHHPLMERSEKEDQIAEWLEENGFEDGYELAENFVDFNFSIEDFEKVKKQVRQEDLAPIVNWLSQVLVTEKLVNEIEEASQRINDLVLSVKSYTHMDQAPEKKSADLHVGINNTLTMLQHKIKKGNIAVNLDFAELPGVSIFVSEMNQVWTNLIDNAIDAMESSDERQLEINTVQDGKFVKTHIIDSGKGIPADIVDQVFDPFFTTKPIGKGTGLGLDVVRQIINQHNGSIDIDSKPGRTEFIVCLPIE